MAVIHEWDDGTVFYIDEEGSYKLDYSGKTADISLVRTSIGTFATSTDKEVPKSYLDEIGQNMHRRNVGVQ